MNTYTAGTVRDGSCRCLSALWAECENKNVFCLIIHLGSTDYEGEELEEMELTKKLAECSDF